MDGTSNASNVSVVVGLFFALTGIVVGIIVGIAVGIVVDIAVGIAVVTVVVGIVVSVVGVEGVHPVTRLALSLPPPF